jgi:4-amino-4-deoxy-L-arabinose transferase-like glycosyltransferase
MNSGSAEIGASGSSNRSWRRRAILIVLLGFILRAVWALAIPIVPVSDTLIYDRLARNLVSGAGYGLEPGRPIAYWPPGAPLLFAAVYSLGGRNLAAVAGIQVILSTLVVALGMVLARRWFGDRPGQWSGLILALWPGQIEYTTVMGTELPFEAALLGALLLWDRAGWSPVRQGFGSGLLLGAGALVRPTGLLLPLVLGVSRAIRERVGSRAVMATVASLVATSLVIAPWTYRNYRAFGRFIPISLNSGSNLWMGNHPESDGRYEKIPERFRGLDEFERDRAMRAEAVASIRADLPRFLGLCVRKAVGFHERETIGVVWNQESIQRRLGAAALSPLKLLSTLYWYGALALGAAGVLVLLGRDGVVRGLAHPAVLIWAYFVAIHAVYISFQDRFHFSVVPLVACLGGLALEALRRRLRDLSTEYGSATELPSTV